MTQATQAIRDFIAAEGSTIIRVDFIKKNGEKRTILFNPRDRKEIKGTGNPTSNPDILRVRDFSIARQQQFGAWRSLNLSSVLSIRSRGRTYSFR